MGSDPMLQPHSINYRGTSCKIPGAEVPLEGSGNYGPQVGKGQSGPELVKAGHNGHFGYTTLGASPNYFSSYQPY